MNIIQCVSKEVRMYCCAAALEVHDNWRRPPYEESPLQVDTSVEHTLHGPSPPAAHGHTIAEQTARAVGTP